jgi:transcriptional regulator with XRE-family HTH domain
MKRTSLGRKLRVLRAERGLTLREASSLTGVTKETISGLERGIRHPHDVTLAKLAEGYGVPVGELLDEEISMAVGKAEAPYPGQRSSEVADYPYPWMGDALARTIDHWAEAVRTRRDPKYSNFVAVSCLDVLSSVLRADMPGDTLTERLPEGEEFDQRVRLAQMLWNVAERAQNHYVDSKEAEAPVVRNLEERREEIRRRSREIREIGA